jgi:hypothetical protein
MVLGAIWCLKEKKDEIFKRIREIKAECGIAKNFEIKWNKVSPARTDFYLRLIDYFFDDDDIHFRALIVPDKSLLNHEQFNQTHDDFYYKMYFDLLKVIFSPTNAYNIYIDIKDTKSQQKVEKLAHILRTNHYDYDKKIIKHVQQIKSHEVELLPLADLLIGAIGNLNSTLMYKKDLPEIICLEDYTGNYHNYIDAVYAVFERDLIKNRPNFGSHKLQLKFHPLFQNRPYTFYHLTHKGEIESEKEPDFRRCERITWVKPTIENTEKWNLKFWKQNRNGKSRVCIQLKVEDDVDYFVILDVRANYILIWTAFIAEYAHETRMQKLRQRA